MKAFVGFALMAFVVLFQAPARAHDHGANRYHLVFSTVHAHVRFTQGPAVGTESQMKIEFKNPADHTPIEPGATVQVELFMPEHGHGSSPTTISKIRGDGTYDVTKLYFVMNGKWDVNVSLVDADGTKETQTFSLELGDHSGH